MFFDKEKYLYKDPNYIETVTSFSIGGLWAKYNNSSFFTSTGAKVHYLAVLDSKDDDDINYWSLTSMTSVEKVTLTDGEGALTGGSNVGVNLAGGTVTVSGAKTTAAVFVQADMTLKFETGATLAIGGGTGPLYIADGKTLTIDFSGYTNLPTEGNPSVDIVRGTILDVNQIRFANVPDGALASVGDNNIKLIWKGIYTNLCSQWNANNQTVYAWRSEDSSIDFHAQTVASVNTSSGEIGSAAQFPGDAWKKMCRTQGGYTAPAPVLFFDSPQYVINEYPNFVPFTLGGLFVTVGGSSIIRGDDGSIELGNSSTAENAAPTYFVFEQSFSVGGTYKKASTSAEHYNRLSGTINMVIADDAVFALPTTSITLDPATSGNLKMSGGGKMYSAGTVIATGAVTLDYSALAADRTTPFIDTTLQVNETTIFKFPKDASFPYPVASRVTRIDPVTATHYVGGVASSKDVVLNIFDGKASELGTIDINSAGTTYHWSERGSTDAAYLVTVGQSATLNIDTEGVSLSRIIFNVAEGKTLTLTGNTLTAGMITIQGGGFVKTSSATMLAGTLFGDGTLIYNGAMPTGLTFTNSGWAGTLWLENKTGVTNFDLSNYGNSGSTIKFAGVSVSLPNANVTYSGSVELSDTMSDSISASYALEIAGGNASNTLTLDGKKLDHSAGLKGNGKLKTATDAPALLVWVKDDYSAFEGSIDNAGNTKIRIGTGSGTVDGDGWILVTTGAGITANGWNSKNNITIRSNLARGDGTSNFQNGGVLTTKTLTLDSDAKMDNNDGATISVETFDANGKINNKNSSATSIAANTMTVGASSTVTGAYYGGGSGTLTLNKASTATYTGYKTLNIAASVEQADTGLSLDALNLGDGATYTTGAGKEGAVHFSGESTGTLNLTATSNQIDYDGHTPAVYGTGTVNYTGTGTGTITKSGYALLPYYSVWTPQAGAGSTGNGAWWRNGTAPAESKNVAFGVAGDSEVAITVNTTLAYGEAQVYGAGSGNFTKTESNAISFTKLSVISGATLTLDADSGVTVGDEIYVEEGATLILDGYAPTCNITGGGTVKLKGNIALTKAVSVAPSVVVASGDAATLSAANAAHKLTASSIAVTGTLTLNGYTLDVPVTGTGSVEVTGTGNVISSDVAVPTVSVSGTTTLNATGAKFDANTINVPEDATLTIDGTLVLTGTNPNFEAFAGFTGGGTIVCSAANTLQGVVKGCVTIRYPAHTLPTGADWTNASWTGTNVLTNCGRQMNSGSYTEVHGSVDFSQYGNANSFIRAPGFKGDSAVAASSSESGEVPYCEATLVVDGDDIFEFNHGNEPIIGAGTAGGFKFKKLVGTGKLRLDGRSDIAQYMFEDVSGFSGDVEITDPNPGEDVGGKKSFIFGLPSAWTVGTGFPANLVIGQGTATVGDGKTWDVPAGIILNDNTTLQLGAGSTVTVLSRRSSDTATLSVPSGTATLTNVNGSVVTTKLNIGASATLRISDTSPSLTSLTIPADATGGTYVNAGTLDLSGCTHLTTLYLVLGESKTFDLTKVSLPVTCTTVYCGIGSERSLTGYTLPSKAGVSVAFYATETAAEYASGSGSTPTPFVVSNVPVGADVWLMRQNGNFVATTVDGTSRTYAGGSSFAGSACWHEWDFEQKDAQQYPDYPNKLNDTGKYGGASGEVTLSTTTSLTIDNYSTYYDTNVAVPVTGETKCSLSSTVQPNANCGSFGTDWSAAVRCTMPSANNTVGIAFGDTLNGILGLATGAQANLVELFNWTTEGYSTLARFPVESSASSMHIYVLVVTEDATTKYVSVYRDGEFIHKAAFQLNSSGSIACFKVGAVYNGSPSSNFTLNDASNGAVDYIRLYDKILDESDVVGLSLRRPFVSATDLFERTPSALADWSQANEWSKTAANTGAKTFEAAPGTGANVTLTTDGSTQLNLNLSDDCTYGTLIFSGSGAVGLHQSSSGKISAAMMVVRGGVDLTVDYDAVNLGSTPVGVDSDATLTFDFSGYPFIEITAAPRTVYLTGEVMATEYDDTVASRILVTGTPEHTWTVSDPAYDSVNKHFYVTITPDHTAGDEIYYKSGYITAGMDGDGGTNIGTVFNNADLAANHKTTLFAGDTVVVSSGSPQNAWISDTFNGNLKVTRTVFNLKPGSPKSILNGRTITVASGSTLNLAKESGRPFSFGAITLAGDGTVNFIDEATVATLTSSVGTLTVANGKTLSVTTLALPAETPVTVGSLLLKVSGAGTVNLSGVTVGGTPTPLKWVRKTVGDIDGIYVISGTFFSVY